MRAKRIHEDMGDVLKGKSENEIEDAIKARLEEFKSMDEEDILDSIAHEFDGMYQLDIAKAIILNTDISARNRAIEDVYRGYVEYVR